MACYFNSRLEELVFGFGLVMQNFKVHWNKVCTDVSGELCLRELEGDDSSFCAIEPLRRVNRPQQRETEGIKEFLDDVRMISNSPQKSSQFGAASIR